MWWYTQQDVALAKGAVLRLATPAVDSDREIRGVGGSISTGNIEFQFPPKVISDSRRGSWEEGELRGTEPVAAFKTSGPREITLSWSYVVDSFEDVSNSWTIDRITKNIRTLRGYFALVREEGPSRKNLVVEFRLWALGGMIDDVRLNGNPYAASNNFNNNYLMSARINSIDVKYGDTIVCPKQVRDSYSEPGTIDVDGAFFLRTDITVDLRLWTKIGTRGTSDAESMQSVQGMRDELTPDWY